VLCEESHDGEMIEKISVKTFPRIKGTANMRVEKKQQKIGDSSQGIQRKEESERNNKSYCERIWGKERRK
jgi:hypothetical protein